MYILASESSSSLPEPVVMWLQDTHRLHVSAISRTHHLPSGNRLTSLGLIVTLPWHNPLLPLNVLMGALSWVQGVRATEH